MLYFTYVVRPGEAPEGRGPQSEPFWNFLVAFNMRLGFSLQCTAYLVMLLCMYMGGKSCFGLLSFLRADIDQVAYAPLMLIQFANILLVVGNLMNMSFQSLVDDDASIKQSRGFRTGTKFLLQGASFAVIGWVLTLLTFWSANHFYDDQWLSQHLGGGTSWLLYFTGRVCDAFSLILYGQALFYMEHFHSEGAGGVYGYLCFAAFNIAAFCEVIGLTLYGTDNLYLVDSIYTGSVIAAQMITLAWAANFEPIIHRYDVKLTQSALRNEYYKSRNAMAYYGPAVVNSEGEVDIAAAAEQAQACLNCAA